MTDVVQWRRSHFGGADFTSVEARTPYAALVMQIDREPSGDLRACLLIGFPGCKPVRFVVPVGTA